MTPLVDGLTGWEITVVSVDVAGVKVLIDLDSELDEGSEAEAFDAAIMPNVAAR